MQPFKCAMGTAAAFVLSIASTAQQGAEAPQLSINLDGMSVSSSVDLTIGGFIYIDAISGRHVAKSQGRDRLGVANAALITTATYENFQFVGLLGSTSLSDGFAADGGSYNELYVIWSDVRGTGANLSAGVQPLMFGLKPAGYEGDRSIMPSLEFGGAGGFAISAQGVAPGGVGIGSAIVDYSLNENMDLRVGVFDSAAMAAVGGDGSEVFSNYFVQVRANDLGGTEGLYGVVGYEGIYVGGLTDSTESIIDVGVGYGQDNWEVSLEFIAFDKAVTMTAKDETYIVVEATCDAVDDWRFMVDYADGDEIDMKTLRVGALTTLNDHASLHFEYADDDGFGDRSSYNVRLSFHF